MKNSFWLIVLTGIISTSALGQTISPPGGGGSATGTAGGVLSGTYPNPGFAASPTFTGTVTFPDASTYSSTGIAGLTGLGISGNGAASAAVQTLSGTLFTGGSGTTTFPEILVQPAGTAAVTSWNTAGSIWGANVVSGFSGYFLDFHVAGSASKFNVDAFGDVTASGQISAATSLRAGGNNFIINGISSGVGQFGATDVDTAPVAQTFRSQGALAGGTSNVAGANWTFLASPGKGTGAGGSFIFQTTPAGSSGTVAGTPTTALTIDSTKLATFAGNIIGGSVAFGGAAISGSNVVNVTGNYSGTGYVQLGQGVTLLGTGGDGSLRISNAAQSNTFFMSAPATAMAQFGALDAASPVAQTLRVQSVVAGTTATSGQNWTLIGSLPTGTGTSGDIILQTGVKTGSGTTQGTATTALTIKGETQAAIFNGPASFNNNSLSNIFNIVVNGVVTSGTTASYVLNQAAASATVPTFSPNKADTTTGIGAQASGNISLIAGGVEIARVTSAQLQLISGKALQLGNAFQSGAVTTTGYITLQDSTGTVYKLNACTGC